MSPVAPFKPLTKEDVAEVLGVSTRTIENWVNDGTLPAARKLGNRAYWHPRTFYEWLDRALSGHDVPEAGGAVARPAPPSAGAHLETSGRERQPRSVRRSQDGVANLRARDQAALDALIASD